jgi:uncharacterized membrane protein|tara:strand:- start:442 stop:570 length:129 start_codon:yes stop_codon:yes gene_type:complete
MSYDLVAINKGNNNMTEDKVILIAYIAICGVVCILLIKGYIG